MYPKVVHKAVWLMAALALSACPATTSGPNITADGGVPRTDGGGGSEDFAISNLARVRFKRAYRIQNSLARSLDLDPETMCTETAANKTTSCFKFHEIGLGGVEPYTLTIYDAPESTSVSAPVAVDRVVLSACRTRVDLDLSNPSVALIFGALDIDSGGGLVDQQSDSVSASIDLLYRRLLSRHATIEETEALVGFYSEVLDDGTTQAARDWALLACYIVGTSLEWLFY